MKKIAIILSLLFLVASSQAQGKKNVLTNNDKRFFGIVQGAYIKNYNAYRVLSEQDGVNNIDVDITNSNTYSLNVIFGYYILPERLSLGVGFGLDGYHNPDINTAPLYGDVRFYFTSERNIPYIYVDYGGIVQLTQEFHKGQVARIGIGYKLFLSKKLCMLFDVSFAAKSISFTDKRVLRSSDNLYIKGIAFTLGFRVF